MVYFFNPNGGWVNYDIDWWYSSYNIKWKRGFIGRNNVSLPINLIFIRR
jgi:hypothetical protein